MVRVWWAVVVCLLLPACQRTLPAPVTKNSLGGVSKTESGAKNAPAPPSTVAQEQPSREDVKNSPPSTEPSPAKPNELSPAEAKSGSEPAPQTDASGQLASAVPAATPTTESQSKQGDASGSAAPGPTAGQEAMERILLLTPGGPLIIDVVLQSRGENFAAGLERLADQAFKTADEDGDGKTTWEDLANNPRFQSGEFGNLVANSEEERKQLIQIYDANDNGLVDREELPRFLTRNAGRGQSFSLRISNLYRTSNRRRSPTRQLIDEDRDGSITVAEMEAAPFKLLNRDTDDDETVLVSELKDTVSDMMAQPMMMSNRRRVTEPDTAVWLTDDSAEISKRWGMVQFQLQELYSYGERVVRDDWPMTPELFDALDRDQDHELVRDELPELLKVPPHLVVELDFDAATEQQTGPVLKLRHLSSEIAALKPNLRELPTRLSLELPNTEIELFVNQDPSLTNVTQTVKAQFMALDGNRNGYLEKEEVPQQAPGIDVPFESLDMDSDGKVYESDLIAYFEQRSVVTRAQVRARAADQEDALFTALDTDGDGRLNTREIRLAPAKLKSLDRNSDGQLQSDEIPGSMVVGFVRGNPQQDDQLFAAPAAARSEADAAAPRWFRGMDANSDGEVSPREFFGTSTKFQQLDVDEDGFITVAEAGKLDDTAPAGKQ